MTWRARPDMAYEHVSRAWLQYTGLSLDQALGDGWSRALHPEDLARWLDAGVRAFDERRPFEIEYRLRRRDGQYRWMLERAAPRYAGEALFVGFTGVCVDIDEHKRLQHSLVRALRELQSPAQAIAAWAGHLRAQVPEAAGAARALESIERNARTQSRIISGLLDAVRAERDARSRAQRDEPMLAGVSVLVVDGDHDRGAALAKMLEVAGAEVRIAAGERDAGEALVAWRPHVVLAGSDGGYSLSRPGAAERQARLAKPVEPVALLEAVARVAEPVGM